MERSGNSKRTDAISELHHRFKNNLQLLVSLCGLQAGRTTNPEVSRALHNMENRIRAVAHNIHERLQRVKGSSLIEAGEYLKNLIRELQSSYDVKHYVRLKLSLADMALDAEQTLSLGLVSNELLSNAFEYAFPGNRTGTISVELRYAATEMGELEISDDGAGLPDGVDFLQDESMGFHIVRILAVQLRAGLHSVSHSH